MSISHSLLLIIAITVLTFIYGETESRITLGPYKVDHISVSGLSSGGFFAVQFHVAYSSLVKGAAIFAGGPFYCAESNLVDAENKCMKGYAGGPNVDELVALTRNDALLGYVDDPDRNLADSKVYIFSGKDDTVVNPTVVKQLQSYYSYFIKSSNIVADYNVQAEHCFPTLSYGEACSTLASPYIGNCNFDGAKYALQTIYGSTLKSGSAVASNLFAFDQTPYFTSKTASIGEIGYIYIPTACQKGSTTCKLHISFHGCQQNLQYIGNSYANNTGFNSWAEANNVIVLYPYVVSSSVAPYNPNGCWDWWAYTDVFYGVKAGIQMQFIRNLVKQISGK